MRWPICILGANQKISMLAAEEEYMLMKIGERLEILKLQKN